MRRIVGCVVGSGYCAHLLREAEPPGSVRRQGYLTPSHDSCAFTHHCLLLFCLCLSRKLPRTSALPLAVHGSQEIRRWWQQPRAFSEGEGLGQVEVRHGVLPSGHEPGGDGEGGAHGRHRVQRERRNRVPARYHYSAGPAGRAAVHVLCCGGAGPARISLLPLRGGVVRPPRRPPHPQRHDHAGHLPAPL